MSECIRGNELVRANVSPQSRQNAEPEARTHPSTCPKRDPGCGGCVLRPLPVQPPSPVTLSRVSRAGCREAGGRAELGALRTGPEATSLPICWRGLWWGGGAGQQAGLGPEQLGPVDSAQRLCGARGLRGGPPPAAGDLDGMVPPRGPQGLLPCPPRPRAGRRAGLLAGLYVNQGLISPSGICV